MTAPLNKRDVFPGAEFMTNQGQIRRVLEVKKDSGEQYLGGASHGSTLVTYKVTKATENFFIREHALGSVHTMRIVPFLFSVRVKVPKTEEGHSEALLTVALSNIVRKYVYGCDSARCLIRPPKGLGVDRNCHCTPDWTTHQLMEAMQQWLTTLHRHHAWIGPGSSLVSDKWIPDLSVRLDADAARHYGAQYFICESIDPRAAKLLCAATGIKLLDKPPAGKTPVAKEELTITRKRVSNAKTNSETKS